MILSCSPKSFPQGLHFERRTSAEMLRVGLLETIAAVSASRSIWSEVLRPSAAPLYQETIFWSMRLRKVPRSLGDYTQSCPIYGTVRQVQYRRRSGMASQWDGFMNAQMTVRRELLNDALTVASENYKDNVRIFANLDDKAQKIGTIAGVFLGALFAFIKPDTVGSLTRNIGSRGVGNLTGIVLLLILCIVLCLLAMWVGKIAPPVTLGHMTILTNDLLRLTEAELTEDIQEGYCGERLAVWTTCIEEQGKVASRKMILVFLAQGVLAVAVLWVAFMLLDLLHAASNGTLPVT